MEVCMIARKVAQDALMHICYRNAIIDEIPRLKNASPTSYGFLKNVCDFVWIESSRIEWTWEAFLQIHFERMKEEPYLFAKYFAYASYILTDESKQTCECFFDVLVLVIHFVIYSWRSNEKKFLNCCVDLFCAFFDKELWQKFEEQGGWKNFNEYIKNQEVFKDFEELNRTKKQVNDMFKEFEAKHKESKKRNKPYVINNVVLENITEDQVENDEKAIRFADSVRDRIQELFNKEFEEVLLDFSNIEDQVKELSLKKGTEASTRVVKGEDKSFLQEDSLQNVPGKDNPKKDGNQRVDEFYQKMFGVASGCMASGSDQSPSQDKPLKNIPCNTNPEKIENLMKEGESSEDALQTSETDSSKFPFASPELSSDVKSNIKKAKKLLKEMIEDIPKIAALFKYVCETDCPVETMESLL